MQTIALRVKGNSMELKVFMINRLVTCKIDESV